MVKKIVFGTRGSRLARVQTESVVNSIKTFNPGIEIYTKTIVSSGDRDRKTTLEQLGTAVFVKELEEALLGKVIDAAVHSFKDVPLEIPSGLRLAVTPERDDPRDVFVSRVSPEKLSPGSLIGTDSARRSAQIKSRYADLTVASIRGNVDTRLGKVGKGYDGVILAAAGLSRLGWRPGHLPDDLLFHYLPVDYFLPAAGQGALVIEVRAGDNDINKLVEPINHLPTWQSVTAERAFLRRLGAGCHSPVAALGTVSGNILKLEGIVADPQGVTELSRATQGSPETAEEIGTALADFLLDMGAKQYIIKAEEYGTR